MYDSVDIGAYCDSDSKLIVDETFWQIPSSLSVLRAQANGTVAELLPRDPRLRRNVQKTDLKMAISSFEQNLLKDFSAQPQNSPVSLPPSTNSNCIQSEVNNGAFNNVTRFESDLKKLQANYSIYAAANRPHPIAQLPKPPPLTNPNYVPKVICKYYMEGKCSKGSSCTFSHVLQPHKTPEQVRSQNAAVICSFYRLGQCMKGTNCLYSHDLSRVPCKYFHKNNGRCKDGDQCRFSHRIPLDDDERKLLEELLADDAVKKQSQVCNEVKTIGTPEKVKPTKFPVKNNKNKLPFVKKPTNIKRDQQQNTNVKRIKALEAAADAIPYDEYEPLPRSN